MPTTLEVRRGRVPCAKNIDAPRKENCKDCKMFVAYGVIPVRGETLYARQHDNMCDNLPTVICSQPEPTGKKLENYEMLKAHFYSEQSEAREPTEAEKTADDGLKHDIDGKHPHYRNIEAPDQ